MPLNNSNKKLIAVHADSSNKRVHFVTFIVSFLIIFAINLLAFFVTPDPNIYITGNDNCPEDYSLFSGYCHTQELKNGRLWKSFITEIGKENMFITINGTFIRQKDLANEEVDFDLSFQTKLTPVEKNYTTKPETSLLLDERVHQQKIRCEKGKEECNPVNFMWLDSIQHKGYKVEIMIQISDVYTRTIRSVKFDTFLRNHNYTYFLMTVRSFCLLISLISGIVYAVFFFKSRKQIRTFEHKYLLILSFLLFFFNDPLYCITINFSQKWMAVASTLSVVVFSSFLLFFWFIMLRRVHTENIKVDTDTINKKTIAILLSIFVLLSVIGISESLIFRFDPSFHMNYELPIIHLVFMIAVIVLSAAFVIYTVYNGYYIKKKWNSLIPRHKFFCFFSLYFAIVFIVIIATGHFHAYEENGIRIILLFGLLNLYIIMLQIFWRFEEGGDTELIFSKELPDNSFDLGKTRNKEQQGFDYFDDDIDVEIHKPGHSLNSIRTNEKEYLPQPNLDLRMITREAQQQQESIDTESDFNEEESSFEIEQDDEPEYDEFNSSSESDNK